MIKLPDEKVIHDGKSEKARQRCEGWNECIAEVQRLNATAQPVSDGWINCSEQMPNPQDARRVCAFTPSEHPDLKLRLVSSDLFKTVCRSATHWMYVDEPAAPGGQDA